MPEEKMSQEITEATYYDVNMSEDDPRYELMVEGIMFALRESEAEFAAGCARDAFEALDAIRAQLNV